MKDRTHWKKAKHRNDYKHGKNGWVSGNPRYNRKRSDDGKNRTMGRNVESRT